jgi:hypothetical protein
MLMTETEEPALALTKAFIEHLCDLPLESWLAVGRAVIASRDEAAYANAWRAVQQAIAKHDLGLAAWHLRDQIETLAYLASHSGMPLSREDRPVFAAAHGAAEDAALALLASSNVSAANLALLCAPFATQASGVAVKREPSSASAPVPQPIAPALGY